MAKPWARKFYDSKRWKSCRKSYISSVHGLCEECLRQGRYKPGIIMHHKITLTPDNINDPYVTLSHENLEYLCLECHNIEHYSNGVLREGLMFDENGDVVER